MHTSKLSTTLLLAALLAFVAGCSSSEENAAPPPQCTLGELGASCGSGAQCCSGKCANDICVKPDGECRAVAGPCGAASDCCLGACPAGTCVNPDDPVNGCSDPGESCAVPEDCCLGTCEGPLGAKVCTTGGTGCHPLAEACTGGTAAEKAASCCTGFCNASGQCDEPTTPTCLEAGGACGTSDALCCSKVCSAGQCEPDAGICSPDGEACGSDAQCCGRICPNAGTPGATCSGVCKQLNEPCAGNDELCCSGVCGVGNVCAPLPPGPTSDPCVTLNDSCAAPTDCCSGNCQGASGGLRNGTCMPVASCSAPGDICYRAEDCCSGQCADPANPGEPGRCDDAAGSCDLDGYPCTNDSNCCTNKCVDLGTGAKACAPSGGCRMTGNYCDSTASCCGGTNPTNLSLPNEYGIFCDSVGTNPGAPEWDTRTQDDRTCTSGQGCNPPGNTCGYKASQNCCHEGTGSGSQVCRYDVGGIKRCFGGPADPETCVPTPGDPCCTRGWDGNDPNCCIQAGDVCQFRDQCCGLAPCVPDATGVLRCGEPPVQCLPSGAICSDAPAPPAGSAPSPDPCCTGAFCTHIGEIGWVCATDSTPPPNCILPDAACSPGGTACCVGACLDVDPTAAVDNRCTSCLPNGNTCASGAECCSTICDDNVCRAPCVPAEGACTVTADCCSPLACEIPPGSTSGTCKGTVTPPCSATGQTCTFDTDCCTFVPGEGGDTCVGGLCTEPPSCSEHFQACTFNGGQCCEGLSCVMLNAFEEEDPCTAGGNCYCNATCAPLTLPPAPPTPCSVLVGCCEGYCADNTTSSSCTSSELSACSCQPIG